jgi:hypothetical protein
MARTPKETPAQKRKVHKVMEEYKEGDLHSGGKKGPKVKSRKQAIAIALKEAGASRPPTGKSAKGGKGKSASASRRGSTHAARSAAAKKAAATRKANARRASSSRHTTRHATHHAFTM